MKDPECSVPEGEAAFNGSGARWRSAYEAVVRSDERVSVVVVKYVVLEWRVFHELLEEQMVGFGLQERREEEENRRVQGIRREHV